MEPLKPSAPNIQRWAQFLKTIRHFFDSNGFYEVFTPNLVPVGAFESTIDPLKVSYRGGSGDLHTSPEIGMKTVLATCGIPIYRICKCFRDELETAVHSREFSMLEFYQPGTSYNDMIDLMKSLLMTVSGKDLPFKEFTIQELFQSNLNLDLLSLETTEQFRFAIGKNNLVELSEDDTWEDMFFRLLIEKIEESLDPEVPTVIKDYPVKVSPLSLTGNKGIAERFEIYWKGMELCNGCSELDDPQEIQSRFKIENGKRVLMGKTAHPLSADLLKSSERMQKTAGVAVGLDRLFRCIP